MHENRETSLVSAQADRSGKANSHKPDAYAREGSDCAIVPVKQPNKEASASAEVVEGRAQTKENDAGPGTSPTLSGERVSKGQAACAKWRCQEFCVNGFRLVDGFRLHWRPSPECGAPRRTAGPARARRWSGR